MSHPCICPLLIKNIMTLSMESDNKCHSHSLPLDLQCRQTSSSFSVKRRMHHHRFLLWFLPLFCLLSCNSVLVVGDNMQLLDKNVMRRHIISSREDLSRTNTSMSSGKDQTFLCFACNALPVKRRREESEKDKHHQD